MRDLTPQEIANAPEWAIEYWIDGAGIIRWSDKNNYQWDNDGKKIEFSSYGFRTKTQPILRKEFDISEYEFSDGDMDIIIEADGGVFVSVDSDRGLYANLSRNDIIALARHSKLTAEDLI